MPSWPPSIVHPTAPIGAVCLIFPSRATPAAQEGANSGSSGYVRTWKCLISSGFSDTSPSPPSCAQFASLPRPIRWAPAALRSGTPCSRTTAASNDSPPKAATKGKCIYMYSMFLVPAGSDCKAGFAAAGSRAWRLSRFTGQVAWPPLSRRHRGA